MDKPWLMGIDLGGGGARCVLVHAGTGEQVSAAFAAGDSSTSHASRIARMKSTGW